MSVNPDESTHKENIAKLELAWRYYYTNATFDRKWLTNAQLHPVIIPKTMDMAVSQITTVVAGERVKEISYPLDWWQAFKERWFPKFMLRWSPVIYHRWKVDFLYPEIKFRHAKAEIAIYDSQRSRGYPHWEDRPAELGEEDNEED